MIIVRLQGGMGNQMFQYALGRSLSIKNKVPLGLDLTFLLDRTPMPSYFTFRDYQLDCFNIQAKIVSKKDIPFLYRKHNFGIFMRYIDYIRRRFISFPGKEKIDLCFDKDILNLGPDIYLEGWWQSYKYFSANENIIRKDFTFNKNFPENISKLKSEIESKNSLCMHIRRGDYVGNKVHEVVNLDYYIKGLKIIKNKVNIDSIYIYSDDIEWCRQNIRFDYPTIFVGPEYVGAKDEGHLALMSACKHFIISNSSFSWWGAWLSDYKGKIVIAPKYWFSDKSINSDDLIPSDWIRI